MVNHVRGRVERAVTGGFGLILIVVGLPLLRAQEPGPRPPARVVGSAPAGGAARDRLAADRLQSISLYRAHCLECHETDGRGESSREAMRRIPDFTKPDWHDAHRDDQLLATIKNGKGMMPSMKKKLDTSETELLVALIRGFRGGRQVISEEEPEALPKPRGATERAGRGSRLSATAAHAPGDSADRRSDGGRRVFARFCIACHGADGHGTAMRAQLPAIPDFASSDWQSSRTDSQLAATILEGKGTAMPAFSGRLGEAQAREVIAFVRTLAPADDRQAHGTTAFRRRFEKLREEFARLDRQYEAQLRP